MLGERSMDAIKVMIVDDERDVETLFKLSFRQEQRAGSIELQFAFSAEEAIEILEKAKQENFIAILSDINMPGLNGFDLLKWIKEKFQELPVFMVSAYNDSKNKGLAQKYGADAFFEKPLNFASLKEKLLELSKS
ncbi:MAG: CheY-like chemotaxis protein [bacterium]|jgi:CheY-like chemotaxis protein